MLVYRICLAQFATSLQASGRAARWNANHVKVIYTSSSLSLACLENVVHRSHLGLNQNFRCLTIHIPDDLKITEIKTAQLTQNWMDFSSLPYTQEIGNNWIKNFKTPILKVPSSIILQENNFLINALHPDFHKITITANEPFVFDNRIKS